MDEAEFIQQFLIADHEDPRIILDIGDDAAVVNVPSKHQLVISTDTLVSGIHFFSDQPAESIAHKALHTNLSDMAAMAATPAWVTLSLTLPDFNHTWMEAFSCRLFQELERANVNLIGGDISRGPLAVSFTILGLVPEDQYIARGKACVEDDIYITGTIGDAALALTLSASQRLYSQYQELVTRLYYPQAQNQLALALREHIHSMIDVSDGLFQDLGKMMGDKGLGAVINTDSIPLSTAFKTHCPPEQSLQLALAGGDDYELCFSAPKDQRKSIIEIAKTLKASIQRIGRVVGDRGIQLLDAEGEIIEGNFAGYNHL